MQLHPPGTRANRRPAPLLKSSGCLAILLALLLSSCSSLDSSKQPGLVPPLPTETPVIQPVSQGEIPQTAGETFPLSSLPSENPTIESLQTDEISGTPPAPPQAEAAASTLPSLTATATSFYYPTRTPTLTPTPALPMAKIQILNPGPASKVVSPLQISAYVVPGYRGIVQIDLLGEDGRLLVRKLLSYAPVSRVHILTGLEFEIPGVAENGRLVISTEDSHNRKVALASVDVLLLSLGSDDVNPAGDLNEPIIIREPVVNTLIQGGTVVASGKARLVGKDPLLVEMIATDGTPIGPTRLAPVSEPGEDGYGTFSVEVPYSVSSPTWVLLTVSELDGRIPGALSLATVEVLLSP